MEAGKSISTTSNKAPIVHCCNPASLIIGSECCSVCVLLHLEWNAFRGIPVLAYIILFEMRPYSNRGNFKGFYSTEAFRNVFQERIRTRLCFLCRSVLELGWSYCFSLVDFVKYTETDMSCIDCTFGNTHLRLLTYQAIPGNDQNSSPTNQNTAGSKLDRSS